MLGKNKIKFLTSLREKKYRIIHKKFIIEGNKIIIDLLESNSFYILELFCTEGWKNSVSADLLKKVNEVTVLKKNEIEKISTLKTASEVIALLEVKEPSLNIKEMKDHLIIVLDNIQDPGNMGTIIRTADWFGIPDIVCSQDTVDCYNPKVLQSTMGSIFRVNVFYRELKTFLHNMTTEKINIYGTFTNGESIYSAELSSNGVILMGNESKGISPGLIKYISKKLTIPFFNKEETVESLNVSVSTAIVCSEFRRREFKNLRK